jgi:hypothetical protein
MALAANEAKKPTPQRVLPSGIYVISPVSASRFALSAPENGAGHTLRLERTKPGASSQLLWVHRSVGGLYTIRSVASGLAMDVRGSSQRAGAPIQQYRFNGTDAQKWSITPADAGGWTLTSQTSGLVAAVASDARANSILFQSRPSASRSRAFIFKPVSSEPLRAGISSIAPSNRPSVRVDISGGSRASGTRAQLYRDNGSAAQRFEVVRINASEYALRSLASGKYLTQEGARVVQRNAPAAGPAARQRWEAQRAPGGVTLINVATGRALEADGNSLRCALPKSGKNAQSFLVSLAQPIGSGTYTVTTATGLALDVRGASLKRGAVVQVYQKNNTGAQKWRLKYEGNGWYSLANVVSKLALASPGASTSKSAPTVQSKPSAAPSQRWKLVPTGDGWFYLQSQSGAWLTASGDGTRNGAATVGSARLSESKAQKFSFRATTYTPQPTYSGTFVDVNLTTQKMFFVKDGVVLLENDVVTGAPYMATPAGTFHILSKASPSILVGADYAAPVMYWMPFTTMGHGFHDADWQPWFGGDRYTYAGSHGCVNMPHAAAAQLYALISPGDKVVIHY